MKKLDLRDWGLRNPAYSDNIYKAKYWREREREQLKELKKGVAKAEIDRKNKILEKHLGNANNICMLWAKQLRKGKDWSGLEKEMNRKTREYQKGEYKNLKNSLKDWDRFWLGHQMKFIGRKQLKLKGRFCKNCNEQIKNWIGKEN